MYDAFDLLARIDRNPVALVGGLAVAMTFQTVWLIAAVRVGRRDRAYSIPVACTYIWFAHDLGFVVRFQHWRSTYDHWFMDLFWIGLFSATILEFVFFAQIIRHGRDELAPGLSRRQFAVIVGAGAVGTIAIWEYLRSIVDDPLYMASSAMTLASYGLLGPALYLRRGGLRGQSLVMWVSFTAMTATWWLTTTLWFPPAFQTPQYLGMGAVTFIAGVVMCAVIVAGRRSRHGAESPSVNPMVGVR